MLMQLLKKVIKGNSLFNSAILNTIAAAIPIVLLQLIILPLLSKKMDSEHYGLLVTILSLLNLIPATMGNALNNIRLLNNNRYKDSDSIGDFNKILIGQLFFVLISTGIICAFYIVNSYNVIITVIHIALTVLLSGMWFYREYGIVHFLINLDYRSVLVNNVLLALGYIIGYLAFLMIGVWEIIYIAGYIFSLTHILINTNLIKEGIKETFLINTIKREYIIYLTSCIIYKMVSFADKLILYPILGGGLVSIYYVSTLSGKVINMIITPVSSVILSYVAKGTQSQKSFKKMLFGGIVMSAIGYVLCVLCSKPILFLLYPEYASEAMKYIYVTTGTIAFGVLISLINPYVLKKKSMKYQLIINSGTLAVYITISMILLKVYGLMGFCIGVLVTNIFKFILMLVVYNMKTKSGEISYGI